MYDPPVSYGLTLLCRASFPAIMQEDGESVIIEVTVYRLNAAAAASYDLDGPESVLTYLGNDAEDTYITRHEIDDIITVVHVNREDEGGAS